MVKKNESGFGKLIIGSIFASPLKKGTDSVAQLVEHIPFKDGVLGSNPSWITIGLRYGSLVKTMKYFTYILYSKSIDKFYIGHTNDLDLRLSEHNRIKGKYTDIGIPWVLVYKESFEDKLDTSQREMQSN